MKIGIMQPYIFPYIGYWQLIHSVDIFVVYDNIEYTKKGWINRNKIMCEGKETLFTIPLKKSSDFDSVEKKVISKEWKPEVFIQRLKNCYRHAPYFYEAMEIVSDALIPPTNNLFHFIYNTIDEICYALDIKTKIIISSDIEINHSLKSYKKVIAITKELEGDVYVNAPGGRKLYTKALFDRAKIKLAFIQPALIPYNHGFIGKVGGGLSIIDVLMYNGIKGTKRMLLNYTIEEAK